MSLRGSRAPELAPSFRLIHNGRELDRTAGEDIVKVRFRERIDSMSMVELRVSIFDSERMKHKNLDGKVFGIGEKYQLIMGYDLNMVHMFEGELVALEPSFTTRQNETMVVRIYDYLHRLARGARTRSYHNVKDSQIVARIAAEYNLKARTDSTGSINDQVIQNNLNDFEFIRSRGAKYDFELSIDRRELRFLKSGRHRTPGIELRFGRDFSEFTPCLSLSAVPSAVEVRSWDDKRKRALVGRSDETVRPEDLTKSVLGPVGVRNWRSGALEIRKTAGNPTEFLIDQARLQRWSEDLKHELTAAQFARQTFGPARSMVTDRIAESPEDAQRMAEAALEEYSDTLVAGTIRMGGNPGLRAGTTVKLTGLGELFSGAYYITEADHEILGNSYRTTIQVRRSGLHEPGGNVPGTER